MYIEVYKRLFYRVKIVGKNGEIMMTSEAYYSEGNANRAAKNLSEKLNLPIK